MNPRVVKRGLIALAAVVVLGAALLVALPLVASTQIVRDRIAQELSAWSGYRVAISEAPEISVWPVFRARLNDVTFTDWERPNAPPAIEAEAIEVDLAALAALRGDIVFSRFSLMRPLLRLTETAEGALVLDGPAGGRLMSAIDKARSIVSENPQSPPPAATLPEATIGAVEFREGRVVITGPERDLPVMTSLTGKLDWATLNRSASLEATAIWRGETVQIEASSAAPLLLVSGASAPVRISLTAQPMTLTFQGDAIFGEEPFIEGQANLTSPSLKRFAEWTEATMPGAPSAGPFSLRGAVSGNAGRLKIENVQLDLGGSQGSGLLEVALTGDVPAVAGTLAFASLNLRPLLSSFSPMAAGDAQIEDPVETGLVGQVIIDLRLSAATATLGSIAMSEVAATIQARDGSASIDISDASAFGGTIQAGLRIDASAPQSAVELKVLAENIDAGALALQTGMKRIVPQARASLSLIARGAGADWATVLNDAEGSLTATLGEGTIIGLDLPAFMSRASEGRFFSLGDIAGGAIAIRGAHLKGVIDNGVLRVERARAEFDQRALNLDGIVPYVARALALSGAQVDPYQLSHPMPRERVQNLQTLAQASRYFDRRDPAELQLRHDLARAKIAAYTMGQGAVQRLFRNDPRGLPALYGDAIATYLHGNPAQSIAKIDALVSQYPNNPYFHELRGEALIRANRPADAVAAFERALRVDPNKSGLIQVGLGQALVAVGTPDALRRAVGELQAGLGRNREFASGYRYLAQAYGMMGNVPEAELATAEGYFHAGGFRDAKIFAMRAQQKLPTGSPGWLRAQDIVDFREPGR